MTTNDRDTPTPTIDLLTCGDASALHANLGDGASLIRIGNLRVMVSREGDHWDAQGIEIDYAVDGTSEDDVKAAFALGLMCTMHEHVRVFGTIRRLLRRVPETVWQRFVDSALEERFTHSQVSFGEIKLDFYLPKAA